MNATKSIILTTISLLCVNNAIIGQVSPQNIWEDFYPLHNGDFWKYTGNVGWLDILETRRVIKREIMPNSKEYARILNIDYIRGLQGYSFERVDTLGNVYEYYAYDNHEELLYSLNVCVGDSFYISTGGYYKVIKKYYFEYTENDSATILCFQYHFTNGISWPQYIYLTEGLGLTFEEGEESHYSLTASCIQGVVHGDTSITSVKQKTEFSPQSIVLRQNYPNPFNRVTKISYEIPHGGQVSLLICNINGEIVKQMEYQNQPAGAYEVDWDGKSENGEDVSSGVYFYQLKTNTNILTRALLFLK